MLRAACCWLGVLGAVCVVAWAGGLGLWFGLVLGLVAWVCGLGWWFGSYHQPMQRCMAWCSFKRIVRPQWFGMVHPFYNNAFHNVKKTGLPQATAKPGSQPST